MQCAYQRKVYLRRYSHRTNPSQLHNLERRSPYRGATPLRCKNSKNGVWQSYRYTGNVNYRQRPSERDGLKATYLQVSTQKNFALARTTTCNGAGIVMIVEQGAVQSRAKAVTAYAIGARRMGHLAVCSSWRTRDRFLVFPALPKNERTRRPEPARTRSGERRSL